MKKLGDLELNKVYHMDCLEGLKRIPDNSIDLIISDPPYNTGFKENKTANWLNSFFNDNLDEWEYEKLMKDTFREFYRVLKDNKPIYIFIDHRNLDLFKKWLLWCNFNYKQIIIWDKVVHGLNYQNYAYKHEYILYFVKGVYTHKKIKHKFDIIHLKRINQDNKIDHETVKPLSLIRNFIIDNSDENDIVLDAFMGSGTTAIASKQTGRYFIGFEIEKKYIDIINNRLKQNILSEELF